MNNKRFSVRAIVITVVVTLLVTLGVGAVAARCLLGPGGLAMLESLGLIHQKFIADYDQSEVVDEALRGLVDGLGDRWSYYLSPEERAVQDEYHQNNYVGIGIRYQQSDDPFGMEIVDVTSGGPADQGGLTVGEFIVGVEGQTLTEDNFDALVESIGGEEGTQVTLTIQTADGARREVTLTRSAVPDPPVEYGLLEGDVGYVRLENFYYHAAEGIQEAVEYLQSEGAKGLIFDVRANPGGFVDQLTEMLDYLLPEGPIFAEHSKHGPTHVVQSDASCVDLPMVVLIDENSYSAAELFAAQLRESGDATLVGLQTCGKGYYQQGFPLENGGLLNISTGMYTTGGGTSLIGVGLTPDYVVEDQDEQFEKAYEVMLDKLEER